MKANVLNVMNARLNARDVLKYSKIPLLMNIIVNKTLIMKEYYLDLLVVPIHSFLIKADFHFRIIDREETKIELEEINIFMKI